MPATAAAAVAETVHIPLRPPVRGAARQVPYPRPRLRIVPRVTVRRAIRVTPDKLLSILNEMLSTQPACEGMRLGGKRWEIDELAAGCNWSETSLIVRVHGSPRPGAFAALRNVIADARAEFDILPSSAS